MGPQKKNVILAPVDRSAEAELLIQEGAGQVYAGMFPSYFRKYPYFLSPNQRTFSEAQMDEHEFEELAGICRRRKVPLYLTINQLFFTREQVPLIIRMARDAAGMGVKGLIMGSVPLMLHLKKARIDVPVHLSTMGVALNHYAVGFFKTLGVRRVTLPRSLLLSEIRDIVKKSPGVSFDTFILVGKCPNVEAFCSFLHTRSDKIWPCEQNYEISSQFTVHSSQRIKGYEIRGKGQRIDRFTTHDSRFTGVLPFTDSPICRFAEHARSVQKQWQGFPRSHGCGICALPALLKAGVTGLKIVGRGSPTSFKLSAVRLVKKALSMKTARSRKDMIRKWRSLYSENFGHECSPFACYFPEAGLCDTKNGRRQA